MGAKFAGFKAAALFAFVVCSAPVTVRADDISVQALQQKPWQYWTEGEIQYGFAHFGQVYPSRIIPAGAIAAKLEVGSQLSYFASGTPGGLDLEQFILDERVAGLLVLHKGKIRLERYALGHSRQGLWTSQSVAKSISSTLVGIALRQGHIDSLDDPVSVYITGLKESAYDLVTIRQLLTMTSGVRWIEDYTDPDSDLGRLYAAPLTAGMSLATNYMRALDREFLAGEKFVYKTGETHLLGDLVMAATGRGLAEYLSETLWKPLGMENDANWGLDESGSELAGCCIQATLRDFARFGQFVLDGGSINGVAVLPDNWFVEATSTQVDTNIPDTGYGYQWWTYTDGTFSAVGIHGQLLHIDAARQLVVVASSAWPEASSDQRKAARNEFLRLIKAALDDEVSM